MEIIKTKDIKNLQFQDLYDFFYSLPSHGFRDFSKDIKTFENEFINLLEDPKYGFLSHKGYGTKAHKEAILKYGPTLIHRMTFKGVVS